VSAAPDPATRTTPAATPEAPPRPLIVQSDRTVLLEVGQPGFEDARDFLALFAEIEKAPEHVHFYRITPISVWNAAAAGLGLDELLAGWPPAAASPCRAASRCRSATGTGASASSS
jgi:DNA excision repair protein ERCC-3